MAVRFLSETYDPDRREAADRLLADGFIFHNAGTEVRGRKAWRAHVDDWLTGFPDLAGTVDFTMSEGDLVLMHWCAEGVHAGAFRGRSATGRRVVSSGLALVRVGSGLLAEMWDEVELFGTRPRLTVT